MQENYSYRNSFFSKYFVILKKIITFVGLFLSFKRMGEETLEPKHIAIIMDGNGRWAINRGERRLNGHVEGGKAVRRAIEGCLAYGIEYLTVYAFSSENWGRPEEEVSGLMSLFCSTIAEEKDSLMEQGVCIRFSGDRANLSSDVLESLVLIEELTKNNSNLTVIVAIDYGSRNEIVNAVKIVAASAVRGDIKCEDITEDDITNNLYINNIPFPDIMVRTSGEHRISNFMLWQIAYSELYFMDKLWPDFTKEDIKDIIDVYVMRDRRYGLVKNL